MESLKGDEQLFNTVFEDSYTRGLFGFELEKELLKETQFRWFNTFKKLMGTKDYESMMCVLTKSENARITKEWFNKLTGYDLNNKSQQFVEQTVREFCNIDLNKKTIVSEWKRYINMTPEEVEKESEDKIRASYFLDKMKKIDVKTLDESDSGSFDWMAKHLRLLKHVKDSKGPMKDSDGEPTKKYTFMKQMGCNADFI